MGKKTKEDFVKEATEKHKGKYDYSKVDYVNCRTKVCIICHKPDHGEFWQEASSHIRGCGCPKCANEANGKRKRSSLSDFITKANEVHEDKYDYSQVKYVDAHTKVCIVCPEHGEFRQRPSDHLNGSGCPKCGIASAADNHRLSLSDFTKKAHEKHGDKYDYSKVKYENAITKVCIICTEPEHGEFWQLPSNHLSGQGCPKCGVKNSSEKQTSTIEEFIKKAKELHGDKYDYSKVKYENAITKVCIICTEPEHGEFWQTPSSHLSGSGCPKCSLIDSANNRRSSKSDFIKKANEVHGDKYDYTKVEYIDALTKVCIICPEHGEFWQEASSHMKGCGCPKCSGMARRLSQDEFIKKANEVHGDKYDYSKVDYVNSVTKVCIICKEHGKFLQNPSNHAQGQGCPKCNLSHLERDVMNYLDEVGITYDYQKRFDWLGRQSLDFYLPDYNVGIECQGRQHFFPVEYFGGKEGLNECKKLDKHKFKKCQKNGIKVLYYSNLGIEYPYDVFEDLDLLFKEIKN